MRPLFAAALVAALCLAGRTDLAAEEGASPAVTDMSVSARLEHVSAIGVVDQDLDEAQPDLPPCPDGRPPVTALRGARRMALSLSGGARSVAGQALTGICRSEVRGVGVPVEITFY